MKLTKRLTAEINYLFFREYRFRREVRRHLSAHYNLTDPEPTREKTIIYMADGRRRHGGLADRLRGIVSTYKICKENGWLFKINFIEPFALEEYLHPADYDWRLRPGELSFNKRWCRAVFQDTRGDVGERELSWQRRVSARQFAAPYRQLHVYTAFYHAEREFCTLFNELFRPAPEVERRLNDIAERIGDRYVSVTTRFRELLGDFREPVHGVDPLPTDQRLRLIDRLIGELSKLHREHGLPILVTSDSERFLSEVAKLEYCTVVEGAISHIDANSANADADLKTFVDFLAISRAQTSYLLLTDRMYNGNFAKRAAALGNHPYIVRRL